MPRSRADSASLRRRTRAKEVEAVFSGVPPDTFDEVLELGAGDGFQGPLLAGYARKVVCTDLNADRLVGSPHERVVYDVCDAEELPYETGRFQLVYSSNLLEHLAQPQRALSEMRRVLRDDGVMVHVVPNRVWKLLHLALFYPSRLVSIAELLLSPERRSTLGKVEGAGNNLSGRRPGFVERNLWPPVHGEYPSHLVEFLCMGASHWRRVFATAGLTLVGRIDRLPAHSPYRFGLEAPRRSLETLGVSSCNGYVVAKEGRAPDAAMMLIRRDG